MPVFRPFFFHLNDLPRFIHVQFSCLDIHKEAIKKNFEQFYQSREQDVNKINDSRGMIMKTYRQFLDSMTTKKFIF